ncbi:PRC1-carboxypeptidase y, serine-type protease [Fusarium fujikuroi]|nr:PRC1-carboxypeptidase y, serine-type protease [Fusarium fujikuroi]SCO56753.1 related to PRC1-carboxypeptidase y, serine-type protease [Fusarium fujikuroi]
MLSLCGLALLQVIAGVRGNPFQWALAALQEEKPTFSVTPQSSDICDAGSRQWTGTVSVTEEKSMFFCTGPGATGELGLFKDIGPCSVNKDGNSTSRNKYSWTDHANVLFIDQPIGVGFSKAKSRYNMAKNIHEAAQELEKFLSVFVSEVFPELASKPWHFAGESFGGHYVTYYLHHLFNEKLHESPLLNVSSAIIVDGYIDGTRQSAGYYDFFCQN